MIYLFGKADQVSIVYDGSFLTGFINGSQIGKSGSVPRSMANPLYHTVCGKVVNNAIRNLTLFSSN
jgi:ribosomal protein L21E